MVGGLHQQRLLQGHQNYETLLNRERYHFLTTLSMDQFITQISPYKPKPFLSFFLFFMPMMVSKVYDHLIRQLLPMTLNYCFYFFLRWL